MRFLSRLYFRILFGLVRSHGFAVVDGEQMANAHISALECLLFCDKSGFLRDGNGNSHKCGKRAEVKVRTHIHRVRDALAEGIGAAFAAEGRRNVW